MIPYNGILSEEEIWDVINYVRVLGAGQVKPRQNMGGQAMDSEAETRMHEGMLTAGVVNTKVYNTIVDYAENLDTLSDQKAIELWNESMKQRDELSKLKKTSFKKFQKILPGKKVVRYFQVENKVWALINAQLAMEIPLMQE